MHMYYFCYLFKFQLPCRKFGEMDLWVFQIFLHSTKDDTNMEEISLLLSFLVLRL